MKGNKVNFFIKICVLRHALKEVTDHTKLISLVRIRAIYR